MESARHSSVRATWSWAAPPAGRFRHATKRRTVGFTDRVLGVFISQPGKDPVRRAAFAFGDKLTGHGYPRSDRSVHGYPCSYR
jgi:hypothetical protein